MIRGKLGRQLLFGAVVLVCMLAFVAASGWYANRNTLPLLRLYSWVMNNPRPAEPQSHDEVLFEVPGIERDTLRVGQSAVRRWFLYAKSDGFLYSRDVLLDSSEDEAVETQIIANQSKYFAPGLAFLEDRPIVFSRNINSKRNHLSVFHDGSWTNFELDTKAMVIDWTADTDTETVLVLLRDRNNGPRKLCRLRPEEAGDRSSWDELELPPMRGWAALECIDGDIHLVLTDQDERQCYARIDANAGSLASAELKQHVVFDGGEPSYDMALRKIGDGLALAFTIGEQQKRVVYAQARLDRPTASKDWHVHTAYRSLMFGSLESFTELDGRPVIHVGDNGEVLLIARKPEPQSIDDWFYAPAATGSPFLNGARVLTVDNELKTYYAGYSDDAVHVISYPEPFVPLDESRNYPQRYEDAYRINNLKQLEESAKAWRELR